MNSITEISGDFTFTRRDCPVPADNRKLWRVSALCLALFYCRGKRASFKKLQLLNWSIRSESSQKVLALFFKEEISAESVIIRFDPGFPLTLNFMVAAEFCELKGKNVVLQEKGKKLAQAIDRAPDLMVREKGFLKEIKPLFTEGHINELLAKII